LREGGLNEGPKDSLITVNILAFEDDSHEFIIMDLGWLRENKALPQC
jgi:hypothetical protein